jgi:hypothetical protein
MHDTVTEEIDYGPLGALLGTWKGDEGMDVAPEPDDDEHNPYFETVVFEEAGDVTNAEEEVLAVVRYHQEVSRKSTGKVFHDQVGYWLWNSETGEIIQTLTIPRGVSLLAGGRASVQGGKTVFEVSAKAGNPDWNIIETAFMHQKARTLSFAHRLEVEGDRMSYSETTLLDIYGKRNYEHTDENVLFRT